MPKQPLSLESLELRAIQPQDNSGIRQIIESALIELGCVGPGFASSDPELNDLYGAYQPTDPRQPDRFYWVIQDRVQNQVLGGGGFGPLKGTPDAICELQKLYFHPSVRGMGFAQLIMEKSIQLATAYGYQVMYLETVPQMTKARALYAQFGFDYLAHPLGNTGHSSCTVFMQKQLKPSH